MAKYLIWLLFLLGTSNVLAQACYCTTPYHPNSTFGSSCTANADCWACAPNAYNQSWQQAFCGNYQAPTPVVTCTTSFTEKTESCQVNYSGIKRFKQETKTCTDGTVTNYGWQLYSENCTPNPPSCFTSTQTQSLTCQTGYVGSITQVQSSVCSNPYAQPVWSGTWITTANTCVKSLTNPTNMTSPVSPVSPANPTSVLTTPTPSATAPQTTAPINQTTTDGSPAQNQVSSAPSSTAQTDAKGTASQTTSTTSATPTAKFSIKTLPLALSLELFSKPMTQPNVFPDLNISQELPNDIKMMQNIYMDLITNGSLFNPDQSDKLKSIVNDAVELEQ